MLRATLPRQTWWNFATERKVKRVVMYGGHRSDVPTNALHRIYLKRFRRGAFPNRTRQHLNVCQTGITQQRPRRMAWPYDMSSLLFNMPRHGSDRVGYVVGTKMLKTAVVAANYLVYYPKFNQRVARTTRVFAHDEDMACVDGDLVHIKLCRKISRYKHYYIFSILEPNIEGRERLKRGLPAASPPLLGYPSQRRIVKLNLNKAEHSKHKLASALQEQVQDFYRFAGTTQSAMSNRPDDASSLADANRMVAANAPPTAGEIEGGTEEGQPLLPGQDFAEPAKDNREKKGEDFWMANEPKSRYDYKNFTKAP
mgnify:CR=1 FL=1